MFVNENDDFSLLREKDKSGRDAISWIEELVEDDFDTYEEIMDFLYDHDPGIDSDDEESEDPRKEICRIAEGKGSHHSKLRNSSARSLRNLYQVTKSCSLEQSTIILSNFLFPIYGRKKTSQILAQFSCFCLVMVK